MQKNSAYAWLFYTQFENSIMSWLDKIKRNWFKVQMKCFFIVEFERAAEIRKIAVYRFLISLLVLEL